MNKPQHIPLTNGPVRNATPPAGRPIHWSNGDQLIEFLIPFPIHIVDTATWPELTCNIGGYTARIERPKTTIDLWQVAGRLGNEAPDAFCTMIRVHLDSQASADPPSPDVIWKTVELMLRWIRVRARHFWLLAGSAGMGATFRGSKLTQAGAAKQENFVSYGPNVIVAPLTASLWKLIEGDLRTGITPPVSESLFCDALLSLAGRDEGKTALELGVSCEVAITQLLDLISSVAPDSEMKREYRSHARTGYYSFEDKINKVPPKLGLPRPSSFGGPRIPSNWKPTVIRWYKQRNSIAHSGTLNCPPGHIFEFVKAANALLAYCDAAPKYAGSGPFELPVSGTQYHQLICFRGGWMTGTGRTA